MKIILISGPSGSGKSTLAKMLLKKAKHGYILSTDSYYKTDLISNIISKFFKSYFDRILSLNINLIKSDLYEILKNKKIYHKYTYDFKNKIVKTKNISVESIDFLIIEGIFALELMDFISKHDYFLIRLNIKKEICLKRVCKRDKKERGKDKINSVRDFKNAWDIYKNKEYKYNVEDKKKELIIEKEINLESLLSKLSINT